jgi:hypothetical protein
MACRDATRSVSGFRMPARPAAWHVCLPCDEAHAGKQAGRTLSYPPDVSQNPAQRKCPVRDPSQFPRPKARQRPGLDQTRRDALSPLSLSNTMGLFGLPLSGSPPKIRCSIPSTATLGQPSQNCIRLRLDGCTAASEAQASGRAVKNRGEKDKGCM